MKKGVVGKKVAGTYFERIHNQKSFLPSLCNSSFDILKSIPTLTCALSSNVFYANVCCNDMITILLSNHHQQAKRKWRKTRRLH